MKKKSNRFSLLLPGLLLVGIALPLGAVGCGDDDGDPVGEDATVEEDASPFRCGNGIKEPGEECDDGNQIAGDGCGPDCQWDAVCGDGLVQALEECDGPDTVPTCVGLGHLGGTVQCNDECVIETDCSDDATGLVAWYKLDGGTGVVADSTGSGNSCTVAGAIERLYPGVVESSYYFDGQTAYVNCGPGVTLGGMTDVTVEAWVKVTDITEAGTFVSRAVDPDRTSYVLGVAGGSIWGDDQYHLFFAGHSLDQAAFSAGIVTTDRWHHVAGVYTAGHLTLLLDGVESGDATQSETGPVFEDADARTHLGHIHDITATSTLSSFFAGYLDEVKIWSVARTQEEICADAGGAPDGSGGCDLELP